jgi:transposase
VPDAATEALRDHVRAREVSKQDQLRARHRVSKFLLRHGHQRPDGMRAWTLKHAQWLAQQRFALPTLQVVFEEYRATIVSELGTLRRFATARQLMGYTGLVPREHSSGSGVHRGAITKTGNAHLRRVLVEAAWAYRHRPTAASGTLRARQQGQPAPIIAIATQAQQRLCPRDRRFHEQGKPPLAVATMIARELLGFIWAIGHAVEPAPTPLGTPMSA